MVRPAKSSPVKTITEVLINTRGDETKAGKILGIGLRGLYRKTGKYGLPH